MDSPCLHAKSMPPLRLSFPPVAFPSPKSAHLGKIPAVFPQMWVKKYRFGGNNLQKSPNVGKSQILTCNLLSGHLWLRRLMLRILLCSRQRALSAVHSHHPAGLTANGSRLFVLGEGGFQAGDDLGFKFGRVHHLHVVSIGEDGFVEVVGEEHFVAENGIGVVHFLRL